MGDSRSISDLLRDADSLAAAVVALTGAYPGLTIDSLLAAERVELLELGWTPSPVRRDCAHLVTIAALLAPVGRAHGNLPVVEAFHRLAPARPCAGPRGDRGVGRGRRGRRPAAPLKDPRLQPGGHGGAQFRALGVERIPEIAAADQRRLNPGRP